MVGDKSHRQCNRTKPVVHDLHVKKKKARYVPDTAFIVEEVYVVASKINSKIHPIFDLSC